MAGQACSFAMMDTGDHGPVSFDEGGERRVETRFVPVADITALDELLPRPGVVFLFLHDPGCGISLRAYREMARLGGDVPLVDVRQARGLSPEIVRAAGAAAMALQDVGASAVAEPAAPEAPRHWWARRRP